MKPQLLKSFAAIVLGLLSTALVSCRMATYTAPTVPRFSISSASPVTLNVYTNVSDQRTEVTGSVKLKDVYGDMGFQLVVLVVYLYVQGTNSSAVLGSAGQFTPVINGGYPYATIGSTNALTVKKSEAQPGKEYTLAVSCLKSSDSGTYTSGGLTAYTNTSYWKTMSAKYLLQVTTDNGQNGISPPSAGIQSLPVDDITKLETTWSISLK